MAGLSRTSPVGLFGYSGGALASGWAAEQQPVYAPELKLAGVAVGGLPGAGTSSARALQGTIFGGIVAPGIVANIRAFPEVGMADILNARGRALLVSGAADCTMDAFTKYPFFNVADYVTVGDYFSDPHFIRMTATTDLGRATPRTPIFEFHSTSDEFIPVAGADALLAHYCAAGLAVERIRMPGEHVTGSSLAISPSMDYLADRFAGKPAPSNC